MDQQKEQRYLSISKQIERLVGGRDNIEGVAAESAEDEAAAAAEAQAA